MSELLGDDVGEAILRDGDSEGSVDTGTDGDPEAAVVTLRVIAGLGVAVPVSVTDGLNVSEPESLPVTLMDGKGDIDRAGDSVVEYALLGVADRDTAGETAPVPLPDIDLDVVRLGVTDCDTDLERDGVGDADALVGERVTTPVVMTGAVEETPMYGVADAYDVFTAKPMADVNGAVA